MLSAVIFIERQYKIRCREGSAVPQSMRKSGKSVSYPVLGMWGIGGITRGLGEPWFMFERAWSRSDPPDVVRSNARCCLSLSGAARYGREDSDNSTGLSHCWGQLFVSNGESSN